MASAATSYGSASACSSEVLEPFKRWLDPARYFLVPGGLFEAGAAGWQLNGSAFVDGNEPFQVAGAKDSSSLSIPAGASATSPFICATLLHPDLRVFIRSNASPIGLLPADVPAHTPLP